MDKKRRDSKRGSSKARSKHLQKSRKNVVKKAGSTKKKAVKKRIVKKASKKKAVKKRRPEHEETFLEKVEERVKKEEELLTQKHVGKYKIPVGIRVLVVYLTFIGILYIVSFFSGLSAPMTLLFGQLITGTASILISLVVILSLLAIIYGLVKRKAYTFDLAIVWFGLGLLNSIVSFFLVDTSRVTFLDHLMFLSLITLVVVNTLVIWYLLSEKRYFYAKEFHDRPWHHKDKVFVYTLVSFWVLVLLIGLSSMFSFYGETTRLVDQTMMELETANAFFTDQVCLDKDGREKDVCILVLATMYNTSDPGKISELCADVESDFLRFTCLRTLR